MIRRFTFLKKISIYIVDIIQGDFGGPLIIVEEDVAYAVRNISMFIYVVCMYVL